VQFLAAVAFSVGSGLFLLGAVILFEQFGPIERYSMQERLPGILMNAVGTILTIFMMYPLSLLWDAIGIAPAITLPLWQWLEPLGTTGYLLQFVLLVLVVDFLAYWRHRTEHKIFWPVHAVHHSPRELHAANDIGHPFQALFSLAFIGIPMSLIQVDGPAVPFVVGAFTSMLAIYIHSPVELHFGPLRRIVVDNRYHRIHHSLEERHFNKNFGICFSFWDTLFGTAYDPGEEWPAVGLADTPAPRTVADYLKLPFRRA